MAANKKTFYIICILGFFIYFAHALTLYIQSSYLQKIVDVQYIGLFVTLATIVNLLVIYAFPQFIKQFTNYWVMVSVTIAYIFGTIFFLISQHILTVLIFYVIQFVSIILIGINLDIFLENITENKRTGKTRTLFLTFINSAIVLGPLVAGFIIDDTENYGPTFIASAGMAAIVLGILLFTRKYLKDRVQYNRRPVVDLFKILKSNASMLHIFSLSFVLRIFYAIMVIYTPLYLHTNIGFSWETIGIIFPIILLPFVVLELPAGQLADKYFGEKEMLILGMVIMAFFTGLMFFISSQSVYLWTGILFMTRVGAALVEAMQEVYFFKIVNKKDIDIINLFRDMTPLGWLFASAISVVILKFYSIQYLFLFLAIIIILNLISAIQLKDTK
ncbi:MAG: hypothetical protein US74_C0019G0011 [Parcubacteria group bacterium GW2011_GWA2_38_13]|nr:MAG: hypothetical protein US74_C0019G0011 [Parcubacteria group bacterium GW2011_GWA2_38_13]